MAAALALSPLVAFAQPVSGPYVSAGVGTNIQNSSNSSNGKVHTRPSISGDAALGYGFGNGFRIQVDNNFDRNTLHKVGNDRVTGNVLTYGPMVDAIYDFNVGLPLYPYVGAGVGYQWQHLRSSKFTNGTEGSFAYKVIGGVSYPVKAVPGLALTAEYDFTQLTANRTYDGSRIGKSTNNTFLLGMRYQLFQPKQTSYEVQPIVAAPAPVSAKTFLVFFNWNSSSLTPRAMDIVNTAANYAKTGKFTTIDVNGYTDTSGTAQYNMALSIKRAKSVAAALVANGVSESDIVIKGYGETHLLVPTMPGVREAQNRRVEIIIK